MLKLHLISTAYRAKEIAVKLGFKDDKAQAEAADIMQKLYKLFKDTDATQVEINPLSETAEGVMCMDAKLGFDENAEFRQEKVFALRDRTQEDAAEVSYYIHLLDKTNCYGG